MDAPSRPRLEAREGSRSGRTVAATVAAAWVAVGALALSRPLLVSHDAMINYAHVWYISHHLSHGLPLRMPILDHGRAFAFPYGLAPWASAALLRPFLGDRVVTVWFVVGAAGVLAATLWALPEVRRGWWAAAALANPAIVAGLLLGQLPFLWGAALVITAAGAWRRGRRGWATALAALGQATHPAVVLPLTAVSVVVLLGFVSDRRRLAAHYAASVALALPAAWLALASPVVADTSIGTKAIALVETLLPRSLIFALPVALAVAAVASRGGRRWLGPAAFAAVVAVNVAQWVPLQLPRSSHALWPEPNTTMIGFVTSGLFVPGATYRLLRIGDGRIGMYQLIQHGARLDSEFFPESMALQSWSSPRSYGSFLSGRHVNYVMVWSGFESVYHTNEQDLLLTMARAPGCSASPVRITPVAQTRTYDLYRVRPCG